MGFGQFEQHDEANDDLLAQTPKSLAQGPGDQPYAVGGVGEYGGVEGVYGGPGSGYGNQGQTGQGSAVAEANRYKQMADASAQRQGPQLDFGKGLINEAMGEQSRDAQETASALQRSAAQGQAPSRAAIEGNQVAGDSLGSALGASAGVKGSGGPLRTLAMQQGAQTQRLNYGIGSRSAEMHGARTAFGQGQSTIRAGDYAGQGLAQDRAEAQAQADMAQRRLNDSRQLGMEQRGFDVTKAQQNAMLTNEEIGAQNAAAHERRRQGQLDNVQQTQTDAANAAGKLGSLSDKRAKTAASLGDNGVNYLYEPSGSELHWEGLKAAPAQGGASLSGRQAKYSVGSGAREREREPAPVVAPKPANKLVHAARKPDAPVDSNDVDTIRYGAAREPEGEDVAAIRGLAPPAEKDVHAIREGDTPYDHPESAIPNKMDPTNPYAHKSLFGNAPEGYAAQRRGHAGYMFGGAPEADYGDLRGKSRDEDNGLAYGSADFAKGEGHALNKKDAQISLSDAAAKQKAYLDGVADGAGEPAPKKDVAARFGQSATMRHAAEDEKVSVPIVKRPPAPRDKAYEAKLATRALWNEGHNPGEGPPAEMLPHEPYQELPPPKPPPPEEGPVPAFEVQDSPPPKQAPGQPNFLSHAIPLGPLSRMARASVSDERGKSVERDGDTTGGSVEDPEMQKHANRQLRGETYRYKDGVGEDTDQVHHGFMAQHLQENPITATAVREDPSGLLKVDNTDVLRVTAAGVASLQDQLDQMTARRRKHGPT